MLSAIVTATAKFQLRFLFASRPDLMGRVLGIFYRVISLQLIKKSGFTRKATQTGAVTLIQRFGDSLNLNVHFQTLFLDGVFSKNRYGKAGFKRTNAPSQQELAALVHTIGHPVVGLLEREGILERKLSRHDALYLAISLHDVFGYHYSVWY